MLAAVLIAACAAPPPPPQMRYLTDSYATLYLGDEGVIVTKQTRAAQPQEAGYWHGGDVAGKPSIVIDLARQKAFFYKAGELGMSPISSGREGYRTRRGASASFRRKRIIFLLYGDYVDSTGSVVVRNVGIVEDQKPAGTFFRGAPMPYFMRIYGGRYACRLPSGCSRFPWMHPFAAADGSTLLRQRTIRHAGHRHSLGAGFAELHFSRASRNYAAVFGSVV